TRTSLAPPTDSLTKIGEDGPVPRLLADLTPLKESQPFRRMWLGTSLSGIGTQLTNVAVALQVFDLTGSNLAVGLVGLFALVPLVVLGLYGGALVDAFDRRRVVLVTQVGIFAVALAFVAISWLEIASPAWLYGLVAVQRGLFAVNSPARMAIVPRLIGVRRLPAANALSSLSFGVAMTIGPLLAGVIVARAGYAWAYGVEAVLLVLAVTCLAGLPSPPPQGEVKKAGLASVLEGLHYLGTRPNVRMTFLVDLSAMVFAMPRVLFPAIGMVLIGGGATTAGILVAGIAFGAVLGGLLSGPLGRVRWQGRAIVGAVAVWGVSVAAFGLVVASAPGPGPGGSAHWTLWPALALMVVAGVADTVSSVFRSTILQSATPDEMRGRLQGVFIVVVAGGPQLGTLLLGALATGIGVGGAAVAGGLACVVVVLALAAWQRGFLAYDALDPKP